MKKSRLAIISLLVALLVVAFLWRRRSLPTAAAEDSDTESSTRPRNQGSAVASVAPNATARSPGASLRGETGVPFRSEVWAQKLKAAEEANRPAAKPQRSRDGYYEGLLERQGRDRVAEQKLQGSVMAAFGNDPATLVGDLMCSSEFCRVELRGIGQVDVRESWQSRLKDAVDPKGLNFFVVNGDDDGNTIASYYFGRDDSWTVPDFHALGML